MESYKITLDGKIYVVPSQQLATLDVGTVLSATDSPREHPGSQGSRSAGQTTQAGENECKPAGAGLTYGTGCHPEGQPRDRPHTLSPHSLNEMPTLLFGN